jgi:hypothetical protein
LSVAGISGFTSLQFEYACSVGVRGTAPHLDLVARTSDAVLGIESKCTEYLQPKVAAFAEAYERVHDIRRDSAWFSLVTDGALRGRFAHLDAAQLVKHYLGLAHAFPTGSVLLLYLFWEPLNAADFKMFHSHREELEEFSRIVAGDRVVFRFQSYPELWTEWSEGGAPTKAHVARLEARYRVRI